MKANELRIGNYVYGVSYRIEIIIQLSNDYCITDHHLPELLSAPMQLEYKYINPIILTEEILLNSGFYKTMDWTFAINLFGNLKLVYYLGEKGFSIGFKNYSDFNNLKFLHQLQNLYFSLTNKELKINL